MTESNSVTVTEQEKALLDLIATAESGVHGYNAYYPGSSDPTIVEKTLAQIDQFQTQRIESGVRSSAIGRYQFIRGTLRSAVQLAGLDPQRTRFTPTVQDYLILAVMKSSRKLNQWLAGSVSSADFQLQLAAEFASVPVPYDVPKGGFTSKVPKRNIKKGETLYAGDGLNAAGHRADAFLQALEDIRNGGTGQAFTEDIGTAGPSGAYPEQGQSPRRVAETATAGGNRVTGGRRNSTMATTNPSSVITLPSPGNVYQYNAIHPHDNRYDFRTGQMIRDIGINGFRPVSENANYTPAASANDTGTQTPGVASGPQVGGTSASQPAETQLSAEQQAYAASSSPVTNPDDPDYYDPRNGSGNTPPPPRTAPSGTANGLPVDSSSRTTGPQ